MRLINKSDKSQWILRSSLRVVMNYIVLQSHNTKLSTISEFTQLLQHNKETSSLTKETFQKVWSSKATKHRIYVNIYLILCFLNELYPIHSDSNENGGKQRADFFLKSYDDLKLNKFFKSFVCLFIFNILVIES